eukprot:m.180974 g.180974  ORF g.180974 m.180974 type:complete len:251 (-) comp18440_c0_seq1:1015-1767(-)
MMNPCTSVQRGLSLHRHFHTLSKAISCTTCTTFQKGSIADCFRRCVQTTPHRLDGEQKFKIYTRTGDKGTSMLFTGERRAKDDIIFTALGHTDELNSFIGLAREYCVDANNGLEGQLEEIQCRLLELGSHIATPRDSGNEGRLLRTTFHEKHTDNLELLIDNMDETLPALKNFILASGGKTSAALHCCRSICRRAERSLVELHRGNAIDSHAYKYINRLSDYFFTAARFAAQHEGQKEVVFKASNVQNDE